MAKTLREVIKETVHFHLKNKKGFVFGQCLAAVGWVGGTLPPLTEKEGMIDLSMADVANGGIVAGAALSNRRPIYVIRYQGFSWFNAPIILNYACKSKELWGVPSPILIRGVAMEGSIGPVAGSSHNSIYYKMPGGLMQLVAYGAQDLYLTGHPMMTFFKLIYRRHTNFATEYIRLDFDTLPVFDAELKSRAKVKIPRHGDMIHDCFFVIDLPAIYGQYISGFNITDDDGELFSAIFILSLVSNRVAFRNTVILHSSNSINLNLWQKIPRAVCYIWK